MKIQDQFFFCNNPIIVSAVESWNGILLQITLLFELLYVRIQTMSWNQKYKEDIDTIRSLDKNEKWKYFWQWIENLLELRLDWPKKQKTEATAAQFQFSKDNTLLLYGDHLRQIKELVTKNVSFIRW